MLKLELMEPDDSLSEFVYCFSSLQNFSSEQQAIIIPNGRIDLAFSKTETGVFRIALLGLETQPKYTKEAIDNFFSVSFNPLATEYLFCEPVSGLLNSGTFLPDGFWGFEAADLNDFECFRSKISAKIHSLLPKEIDGRKKLLFRLIFEANGEISIQELSEKIFWSQRQINRYFNHQFGLSVKAYCKILRFQASLPFIKKGQLSPQLSFTDQSHFIKEIKQFSGVSPKELYRNKNDRFLQFLAFEDT